MQRPRTAVTEARISDCHPKLRRRHSAPRHDYNRERVYKYDIFSFFIPWSLLKKTVTCFTYSLQLVTTPYL
jgi:hypothetical protein